MNNQLTVHDVIDFVDRRKDKCKLAGWSKLQVAEYVLDYINRGLIRSVVEADGSISGVVLFTPFRAGQFWVDQIWADSKSAMQRMVEQLQKEYPYVQEVWGLRKSSRRVPFKLATLIKIYG